MSHSKIGRLNLLQHRNIVKNLLLVLESAFLSFLVILQTIDQTTFSHDYSSYIAPIRSMLDTGLGPYTIYWDIKPPFLYLILGVFYQFIQISLISSYLLYFLILLSFFTLFQKILLASDFRNNRFYVFLILLFSLVLSDFFLKMFFPSEIIGVTLILAAINLLSKKNTFCYFLGFICCHIAGQSKDVFIFSAFAIVIHLFLHGIKSIKVISLFSTSFFLVLSIEYIFLRRISALDSYMAIIQSKSEIFEINPEVNLIKLPIIFILSYMENYTLSGFITPLIFIIVLLIDWKVAKRNKKINTHRNVLWESIKLINLNKLLASSILFGMLWQGAGFGEHYALALMPFMIIIIYDLFVANYSSNKVITVITCLILFIPSLNVLNSTSRQIMANFNDMPKLVYKIISEEEARQFQLPVKRCLQVAYGWNSGVYYYYNRINPCSRFYLVSHLLIDKDLASSFRSDLLNNPPSEIIYQTARSGIDFQLFESSVFPYTNVLNNCYIKSQSPNLYIEKYNETAMLVSCIEYAIRSLSR